MGYLMHENHIAHNWESFEAYRKKDNKGLATGFSQIDRKIVGLAGLVTVMGEPKCCKSTFVMSIALHSAQLGIPVIYIDRENGIQRTRTRMLCYLSNLSIGAIKGSMYENEQKYYDQAQSILTKLPIYYFAEMPTLDKLDELVSAMGKKYNKRILLLIDSLQSIISDFKDRRSSVDYWVFAFNDLKNKYGEWLTTILVSEKNRPSYGMSSKSGAKESGGIEYKAEQVFDLYLDNKSMNIMVNCVFNRDGDTGLVTELIKPQPYTYKLKEIEHCPQ